MFSAETAIDDWAQQFESEHVTGGVSSHRRPHVPWPPLRRLSDLSVHYENASVMKLAVRSICSAVLKDRIVWVTESGEEIEDRPAEVGEQRVAS